jgi:transcription elongation GreA/GreB family factor
MELFLKAIEDYESLNGVEHTDYAVRALHALVARDGEQGIVRAAEYLPVAPARLAQAIWKELDPEHHIQLAVRALRTLFEYPLENPETYLWTVRSITEGKWAHLEDFIPLSSLVVDLFDGLDRWQQVCDRGSAEAETLTRAKWLVGKVRAILHARNFAAICAAAESMTLEQAQDLRRTIQLHPALPEAFRNGADHQLRLTRRDLEGTTTAPPPSADSGIHYCTMLAHSRAVHDLHELNTVKIPQNAREIEKARSEGDLRENAGYHGAREKHVLLLQQAHFLQQGLVRARIMTADKISVAAVGFGVNFDAENLTTGTRETYKVLGQWESDPEQGIYSYQAPFLQNFVGRKAGEEFTVRMPDGTESRYRICEISNALESGDWDKAAEYTV